MDYKYHDLTPVEQHGGIFFKRDDLYQPFVDFGISGSKLRQCLKLVESNLEAIRELHGGTISTAVSVHSPQGPIVSRVAREFGLRCIIGHASKDVLKHKALLMCAENGAGLIRLAGTGFNNVIYSKLNDLPESEKGFVIDFGYESKERNANVIGVVAHQVQNLPDDLDYLVIPVGSGVTASAILHGLHVYKPHLLSKTKLIQPFGYNRMKVIESTFHENYKPPVSYSFGDYPYKAHMNIFVPPDLFLDGMYEAKAYVWMIKELWSNVSSWAKICFWLIGNSNVLRS